MNATADQHPSVTVKVSSATVLRRGGVFPVAGARVGHYVLLREIGRGGMGTVFAAEHATLGRQVAIKMLSTETLGREATWRFFNEARAAVQIHHPAIVDVHHFGFMDDGRSYIVMERLRGESLAERLHRVGRLAAPEAVAIARRVAAGLAAAHAAGIVHRDLKPGNVFVVAAADGGEPVIKLLDFGVAKLSRAAGSLTTREVCRGTEPQPPSCSMETCQNAVLGTPCYMAPEQWRAAADVDHRADLYSLGCMLFTMLAGSSPFGGSSHVETAYAHQHAAVPTLSELAPRLPRALYVLVARLLAKRPDARPASAQAVDTELASIECAMRRRATMRRLTFAMCAVLIAAASGSVGMSVGAARSGPPGPTKSVTTHEPTSALPPVPTAEDEVAVRASSSETGRCPARRR